MEEKNEERERERESNNSFVWENMYKMGKRISNLQ